MIQLILSIYIKCTIILESEELQNCFDSHDTTDRMLCLESVSPGVRDLCKLLAISWCIHKLSYLALLVSILHLYYIAGICWFYAGEFFEIFGIPKLSKRDGLSALIITKGLSSSSQNLLNRCIENKTSNEYIYIIFADGVLS